MGTGAGKSLGRAEGREGAGGRGGIRHICKRGGRQGGRGGVISLGGVLQQSPPLTPGRAVKGRA